MSVIYVVGEEIIKQAAMACSDDPGSTFIKVLSDGEAYKKAGLTPIYFYNKTEGYVSVTYEEKTQTKIM